MSTNKHFDQFAAAVMVLALLLTVLFVNGEALGVEKVVDEDAEQYESATFFTANDLNGSWDTSRATATVALNGDSAKISGNGAYFNGGSVVITGAGYYVFSGSLDDGGIVVDAYGSSKVFLLLNGVTLYRSDDACLRVEQAEKVFLTLAEGTDNRMESGAAYSETALAGKTGGTIFARDDLTINGGGSLTIVANYKHGVDANDDLVITGGTISVTAPQDGLHVNDSFRMREANVTIAAGDDGIHSDADIYIESGTLRIPSCYEGLEALRVEIAGGDIEIYPTDDGLNANGGSGGFGGMMGGGRGGAFGEGAVDGGFGGGRAGRPGRFNTERSESTGGFGGELPRIPGGFDGEPPQIPGGFGGETPQTPDGFDDRTPRMDGGMMGGAQTGGADADGAAGDTETYIRITGGNILIVNENGRDADGLDSNGSIYIEGGTILVSLSGSGGNSAIDCGSENGGVAQISGGTVIAAGGSSMAESFDDTSAQPSITYTGSVAAGSAVALRDAAGKTLLEWTVPCAFTHLTVSCPAMTLGEAYTLVLGENEEEAVLDSAVTTLGSGSGTDGFGAFPGGFGGFGRGDADAWFNRGGMNGGPGRGGAPGGNGAGNQQE